MNRINLFPVLNGWKKKKENRGEKKMNFLFLSFFFDF